MFLQIIDFLTKTPLGLAVVIGVLIVFFFLVAFLYERKTRKLYPDQGRRGTKAVAKAKAKKKAAAAAAKQSAEKESEEEESEEDSEEEDSEEEESEKEESEEESSKD